MLKLAAENYGMVMKLEDKGTHVRARLSTSKKNKKTGEYENSWWNAVFLMDDCVADARELKEKDRIIITDGTVQIEEYDSNGKKGISPKVCIFGFRMNVDTRPKREEIAKKGTIKPEPEDDGEENDLPF